MQVPIVFTHHTLYERYTHYVPLDSPALRRVVIRLATEYCNLCDEVIAPSGSYDRDRPVNAGRNYWAIEPSAALTYLNMQNGREFSAMAGWTFNDENPSTNWGRGGGARRDRARSAATRSSSTRPARSRPARCASRPSWSRAR